MAAGEEDDDFLEVQCETSLTTAAWKAKLPDVRQLLKERADPNALGGSGASALTPLMAACASGNVGVAAALLLAGADPGFRSPSGVTPGDLANNQKVAKMLAAFNAKIDNEILQANPLAENMEEIRTGIVQRVAKQDGPSLVEKAIAVVKKPKMRVVKVRGPNGKLQAKLMPITRKLQPKLRRGAVDGVVGAVEDFGLTGEDARKARKRFMEEKEAARSKKIAQRAAARRFAEQSRAEAEELRLQQIAEKAAKRRGRDEEADRAARIAERAASRRGRDLEAERAARVAARIASRRFRVDPEAERAKKIAERAQARRGLDEEALRQRRVAARVQARRGPEGDEARAQRVADRAAARRSAAAAAAEAAEKVREAIANKAASSAPADREPPTDDEADVAEAKPEPAKGKDAVRSQRRAIEDLFKDESVAPPAKETRPEAEENEGLGPEESEDEEQELLPEGWKKRRGAFGDFYVHLETGKWQWRRPFFAGKQAAKPLEPTKPIRNLAAEEEEASSPSIEGDDDVFVAAKAPQEDDGIHLVQTEQQKKRAELRAAQRAARQKRAQEERAAAATLQPVTCTALALLPDDDEAAKKVKKKKLAEYIACFSCGASGELITCGFCGAESVCKVCSTCSKCGRATGFHATPSQVCNPGFLSCPKAEPKKKEESKSKKKKDKKGKRKKKGKDSGSSSEAGGKALRYLADNSVLKAESQGLAFRKSKNLKDYVLLDEGDKGQFAVWGRSVTGVDVGDGWLQVGEHYLPMTLNGVQVIKLRKAGESSSPERRKPSRSKSRSRRRPARSKSRSKTPRPHRPASASPSSSPERPHRPASASDSDS